jgi:hypothetical protein
MGLGYRRTPDPVELERWRQLNGESAGCNWEGGLSHTQPGLAAGLNHSFDHSPIDSSVDFVVGRWLRFQIRLRLALRPAVHPRRTVFPKRRFACRRYARRLRPNPAVIE